MYNENKLNNESNLMVTNANLYYQIINEYQDNMYILS